MESSNGVFTPFMIPPHGIKKRDSCESEKETATNRIALGKRSHDEDGHHQISRRGIPDSDLGLPVHGGRRCGPARPGLPDDHPRCPNRDRDIRRSRSEADGDHGGRRTDPRGRPRGDGSGSPQGRQGGLGIDEHHLAAARSGRRDRPVEAGARSEPAFRPDRLLTGHLTKDRPTRRRRSSGGPEGSHARVTRLRRTVPSPRGRPSTPDRTRIRIDRALNRRGALATP